MRSTKCIKEILQASFKKKYSQNDEEKKLEKNVQCKRLNMITTNITLSSKIYNNFFLRLAVLSRKK
jgi:hypothetical protein